MNRRFETVTPAQWESAVALANRHEDIDQALYYLKTNRSSAIRIAATAAPERKRKVLLEYAIRRGLKIQTLVPRGDGWIYIRLRPEGAKKRGPRRFEEITADEWGKRNSA